MNTRIFISYRRDDSIGSIGRLYHRLVDHFTANKIVIDPDIISAGVDFAEAIENEVGRCDIVLAVIGRNWLHSQDSMGNRKLDNPFDAIRIELKTALTRKIHLIPILIDGALMPNPRDLPEDIKSLSRRNAIELSITRFDTDCDVLIKALEKGVNIEVDKVITRMNYEQLKPVQNEDKVKNKDVQFKLELAEIEKKKQAEEQAKLKQADEERNKVAEAQVRLEEENKKKNELYQRELSKDTSIFFSYSRNDSSEFALSLAEELRNVHANIWIDQLDIHGGAKWDVEIEKALKASTCVLFIVSKESVKSDNVLDEVYYALNKRKQVIPIIIGDCEVPYRIERLQQINFSRDYNLGLKQLLKALNLNK